MVKAKKRRKQLTTWNFYFNRFKVSKADKMRLDQRAIAQKRLPSYYATASIRTDTVKEALQILKKRYPKATNIRMGFGR